MQDSGKAIKKSIEIDFCVNKGVASLHRWCKEIGADFNKNFEVTKSPPIYAEHIKVKTLEGHSYDIPIGYIVIRGSNDDFYPHDPELFAQNYVVSKQSEPPPFLSVMLDEKKDLAEKISKLNKFLQSKKAREFDADYLDLMFRQREHTKGCLKQLEKRIDFILENQ